MPIDLALDTDGDLPLYGRPHVGAELVAQRVYIRLTTHLGEGLRDATKGLPYVVWLTTKPVAVDAIVARVRREVRETVGVVSVSDWTGSLNRTTGLLTVTGNAVTADGTHLEIVATPTAVGGNTYPAITIRPRAIVVAPTAP
jgi:hypothetical protein